jgi:hypothetical protein
MTITVSSTARRGHRGHDDARSSRGYGRYDDTLSRRARLERLEWMASLLDSAIVLPGGFSIGLDAVAGLVPGVGDAVTTMISLWMVKEAHELGVPKHVIARMVGNVAIDAVVGAVPVVGDAFDIVWRANKRNMKLLRDHFAREGLV